jgi:hypothetical protein
MLAVVFGITRFHTYLFGRPFKVITDHKPLEMIVQKPLLKAPPRLQRMLQKIQGYDFVVEYRSGKTMTLADTLSRLPCPTDRDAIDLDLRVDGVDLSRDEISFCEFDFISFTPKKQFQLREATKTDPILNALMEIIVNGWPENMKELPCDLRPYWSFRDELAIEDGIIFKGQEVIIPQIMRADVLSQLHISHQGIEKTRLLAKECAYWPNINRDIEELVKTCDACQEFARANTKEPLIPKQQPPARENINPHQSPTKAVDQPHGARATTSSDMGETTQASALPAETQRVTRSGRQVVMPARYRE